MINRLSIRDTVPLVALLTLWATAFGAAEAAAQRRAPSNTASSSSQGTRVAVPRASAPAPSSAAAAPRVSRPPTARDTRRYPVGDYKRRGGHRPPGHGGYGGHGGFYFNYHYPYWGWWGPHWGWGSPYWGWWGPSWAWAYPRVQHVAHLGADMGGLRLKVKPKRAQVFLDGEPIGLVKDFDGWPSYLWLEEGTYQLTFYREGYRTSTASYSVRPGLLVDVRLRLDRGESTPPPRVARAPTPPVPVSAPEPSDSAGVPAPGRAAEQAEPDEAGRDLRGEPGRLQLEVAPLDAAVYLDGRLLGSGKELARLHSSLLVDPGRHVLEVVRPGFRSEKLDFSVEAGQDLDLKVALTEG